MSDVSPLAALARNAGRLLTGFGAVVTVVFDTLREAAETFRRLMPLGADGWAISTFGMLALPDAHLAASRLAATDPAAAEAELVAGWSQPRAQRLMNSIVPYVYPPDSREIGERRRELLDRASDRYADGHYAEATLLLYSQVEGLFIDMAEQLGEEAFTRLFSKRPVATKNAPAREFVDIVKAAAVMSAAEPEFFLTVRDQVGSGVDVTMLGDHPSRHGILHGRVLGYDTQLRAAQSFAFLAACLEIVVAAHGQLPLSDEERYDVPFSTLPEGLTFVVQARAFNPIRTVYVALQEPERPSLMTVPQSDQAELDSSDGE